MPINFRLDPASGVPFYRQVIDQILAGIATGALAPGEQLPTVRTLAVELQVNLNTVAKAYKELEIRGVLTSQQGSGTYIAPVQVERDEVAESCRRRHVRADLDAAIGAYEQVAKLRGALDETNRLRNEHQKSARKKMEPAER